MFKRKAISWLLLFGLLCWPCHWWCRLLWQGQRPRAPFGKKEVIVFSVWGDAAVGIYNKKQNDTTECYFSKAFVFMNSCHNATKNDRQWCHHFTIFVGQATARMASQENQPSSCDVAGSAMPREDALLNLTSPSWKKVPSTPKKKITSQIHAVSTFPWPFWICFVSVACSELRLMHYGHVTQQLWFRCQVQVCHFQFQPLFWCFGCCIWICHAAIKRSI